MEGDANARAVARLRPNHALAQHSGADALERADARRQARCPFRSLGQCSLRAPADCLDGPQRNLNRAEPGIERDIPTDLLGEARRVSEGKGDQEPREPP